MLWKKKKKNTFVAEIAFGSRFGMSRGQKVSVKIVGEVLEWLKRHAWKACIRQKCIAGSNPALSAKFMINNDNNNKFN